MNGVLRRTSLATTTVAAMAGEDPAVLAVQVSRRLPRRLTNWVSRQLLAVGAGKPGSSATATGLWLAGRRDEARTAVRDALTGRPHRFLAEVAVELDALDVDVPMRAATAARLAWRRGDLTRAIDAAPAGSRQRRRLAAEHALLRQGPGLAGSRSKAVTPRGDTSALHVLTSSVPHTASGYSLRSHSVLKAQQAAGIRVEAATRLAYPLSIGRLRTRDTEVVDNITYHRLLPWTQARMPDARLRQQAELLTRLAAAMRPQVLHTTTHYVNALVTESVSQATGLPWVYEVRGLLEDTWVASFPTSEAQAVAAASERHRTLRAREAELASRADRVVVLGDTVRADLVARGVPDRLITTIPNAVDATTLTIDVSPAEARRTLGLPEEGYWVGTVTSLVDYEGIDTLLDAVAALRARGEDVRAAVVGDGVSWPALARRVTKLRLEPFVVLPGRVNPRDVDAWYLALDAFVVPRKDAAVTRSVVPLKPMQAMAFARPVVASNLPALDEIIGVPGAGLLVAPDDPAALAADIGKLRGDATLAGRLGQAGRAFAATRTWEVVGRQYRSLYEELTA